MIQLDRARTTIVDDAASIMMGTMTHRVEQQLLLIAFTTWIG